MLTQKRDELAEQRSALAQSSRVTCQATRIRAADQALQPGHTGGGLEFMSGDPAGKASWRPQAPAGARQDVKTL